MNETEGARIQGGQCILTCIDKEGRMTTVLASRRHRRRFPLRYPCLVFDYKKRQWASYAVDGTRTPIDLFDIINPRRRRHDNSVD